MKRENREAKKTWLTHLHNQYVLKGARRHEKREGERQNNYSWFRTERHTHTNAKTSVAQQGHERSRKMTASSTLEISVPAGLLWMSHWNSWDSANVCLINWRQLGTIYNRSHSPTVQRRSVTVNKKRKKNLNRHVTVCRFQTKGFSRAWSHASSRPLSYLFSVQ